MELIALPAFSDNYIWLLHNGSQALVVDPGDAAPVTEALCQHGLKLQAILVTHHHRDHTGGVQALRQSTGARVYGSARERIKSPYEPLSEGQQVRALGLTFKVLDVPGHTAGHIAYFCPNFPHKPLLFCGDTLFSGGCGYIFEGTPTQMLASLDKLATLPDNTLVCSAHEYTLNNLRFARAVEPHNTTLIEYEQRCRALRDRHQPTLPAQLGRERAINPFLRSRQPDVVQAVRTQVPSATDEVAVFTALRQWKTEFK